MIATELDRRRLRGADREDRARARLRLRELQGEVPAAPHRRAHARARRAHVSRTTRACSTATPRSTSGCSTRSRSTSRSCSGTGRRLDAWRDRVVPTSGSGRLRVPSVCGAPGCSSGEEPYSLAILFHQHAAARGDVGRASRVQVLGSDIDRASPRRRAPRRSSTETRFADTPAELRRRYFSARPPFDVVPEIRRWCASSGATCSPSAPPGRHHLICCRNVLIYFDRDDAGAPVPAVPRRAGAGWLPGARQGRDAARRRRATDSRRSTRASASSGRL